MSCEILLGPEAVALGAIHAALPGIQGLFRRSEWI